MSKLRLEPDKKETRGKSKNNWRRKKRRRKKRKISQKIQQPPR